MIYLDEEYEKNKPKSHEHVPDENIYFIETLLTKKDQEHKAELEIIKGEINNSMMAEYLPVVPGVDIKNVLPQRIGAMGYNAGQLNTISILDNHINKLSTE